MTFSVVCFSDNELCQTDPFKTYSVLMLKALTTEPVYSPLLYRKQDILLYQEIH